MWTSQQANHQPPVAPYYSDHPQASVLSFSQKFATIHFQTKQQLFEMCDACTSKGFIKLIGFLDPRQLA